MLLTPESHGKTYLTRDGRKAKLEYFPNDIPHLMSPYVCEIEGAGQTNEEGIFLHNVYFVQDDGFMQPKNLVEGRKETPEDLVSELTTTNGENNG